MATHLGPALAVLDAEQNAPGSNITNIGDALWWAFATITTVGYGDFYPVTVLGRLIAAGLMIAGITMLGTVTAALASWFVEALASGQPSRTAEQNRVNEMDGPSSPAA